MRATMRPPKALILGLIGLMVASTLQSNKFLFATLQNQRTFGSLSTSVTGAINATYETFYSQQSFNLSTSINEAFNATYEAFVSTSKALWFTEEEGDDESDANNQTFISPPLVDEDGLDLDTSVIITSSLIPTHPSIAMINETIHSLYHLRGLSPHAPIYITVDGLPVNKTEDFHRIRAYVRNLHYEFGNRTNFHILASDEHRHIAGSVKMAIDRITTKYIYVLQHDFPFIRDIDHTNLRKSMEEYPQYIRNVRFEYKRRNQGRPCTYWQRTLNITETTPAAYVNGLYITLLQKWSDNNHFTTLKYYQDMLKGMVYLKRPMEDPMQVQASRNCSYNGQSIYGKLGAPGGYLKHLDGKRTQQAPMVVANASTNAQRF